MEKKWKKKWRKNGEKNGEKMNQIEIVFVIVLESFYRVFIAFLKPEYSRVIGLHTPSLCIIHSFSPISKF